MNLYLEEITMTHQSIINVPGWCKWCAHCEEPFDHRRQGTLMRWICPSWAPSGGLISYFIYLYCLPQNLRECHFVELLNVSSLLWFSFFQSPFNFFFQFVSNGRELFSEVRRLNVQGCVLEIKDFTFLAKLMPKIWFIRCSAHTLVLPER